MMQEQSQDLDHFPVSVGMAQQMPLQSLDVLGKLEERCAVAQGTRLALDDRERMSPVIDGVAGAIMGSMADAVMFAYDLPPGADQDVIGLDEQADGAMCDGRRHALADTTQMTTAGRRRPTAI